MSQRISQSQLSSILKNATISKHFEVSVDYLSRHADENRGVYNYLDKLGFDQQFYYEESKYFVYATSKGYQTFSNFVKNVLYPLAGVSGLDSGFVFKIVYNVSKTKSKPKIQSNLYLNKQLKHGMNIIVPD